VDVIDTSATIQTMTTDPDQIAPVKTPSNSAGAPPVDWLMMMATYFGAALIFYPLARWVLQRTEASEQLFHALIVLGAAGGFLLLEKRRRMQLVLTHDRESVALLAWSFSLAALSMLIPGQSGDPGTAYGKTIILLAGFGFAIASLVRFTFGPLAARAARGFIVAFFIFMVLALLLPLLDWPLRGLAGKWSLYLLQMIGQGAMLELVYAPQPVLVLAVEGHPFIVAAECNGFGLLSSSLLLTVLLAIYRRLVPIDLLLVMILALLTAFVANTLRILVIVLLAPSVTNYMLMHEVVGLVFFYGALAFLWWFVWGFGPQNRIKRSPNTPVSPSH